MDINFSLFYVKSSPILRQNGITDCVTFRQYKVGHRYSCSCPVLPCPKHWSRNERFGASPERAQISSSLLAAYKDVWGFIVIRRSFKFSSDAFKFFHLSQLTLKLRALHIIMTPTLTSSRIRAKIQLLCLFMNLYMSKIDNFVFERQC